MLGLQAGDRVGICAVNSPEWMVTMQVSMSGGGNDDDGYGDDDADADGDGGDEGEEQEWGGCVQEKVEEKEDEEGDS